MTFGDETLEVGVDDFKAAFDVAQMPNVFGPGPIRFQCFRCRTALVEVSLPDPLVDAFKITTGPREFYVRFDLLVAND